MTFTLTQLWQLFLAMCGSIATIAGAVAVLYGIYKALKKPDSERDMKLKVMLCVSLVNRKEVHYGKINNEWC